MKALAIKLRYKHNKGKKTSKRKEFRIENKNKRTYYMVHYEDWDDWGWINFNSRIFLHVSALLLLHEQRSWNGTSIGLVEKIDLIKCVIIPNFHICLDEWKIVLNIPGVFSKNSRIWPWIRNYWILTIDVRRDDWVNCWFFVMCSEYATIMGPSKSGKVRLIINRLALHSTIRSLVSKDLLFMLLCGRL